MSWDNALDYQVEILIAKIKHHFITSTGKTLDEADDHEFFRALSWAIREEIMINWAATNHTIRKTQTPVVYYLSMEYMPGRLLQNNISNISQHDLIKHVLHKLNRNYHTTLEMEAEIGIGNGGLGRLASCLLDSLATQKYPAMGYGMRYQYGIFEQEIFCGVQIERPDCWLLYENPWSFRRDDHSINVHFAGQMHPKENEKKERYYELKDYDEVRALAYDFPIVGYSTSNNFSVLTLRLWSTKESPRNFQLQRYNSGQLDEAAENTSLTDVLYPNDNNEMGKRVRLKQEFLLVSASLKDIVNMHMHRFQTMDNFRDKVRIQINDTHPALAVCELIRMLTAHYNYTFDEAFEITQQVISYTNHTVLKEALEEWNVTRLQHMLPRQYEIIERLNHKLRTEVSQRFPQDAARLERMEIISYGQIRMANMAIYGCHKVNGVAQLHTQILQQQVFRDFHEMYPDKITNVTNGVTQRRWLLNCNHRLAEFISEKIGFGWTTDFTQMAKFAQFAQDPEVLRRLQEVKKHNKTMLLNLLREQARQDKVPEEEVHNGLFLDESALFDVQIKRIHEYKRQLMCALHALILYHEISSGVNRQKRLILFGGKAAPGYVMAKNIIRFIYCLSRTINKDPKVNKILRIAYVENYCVSKAEVIIPAADLSEQLSTAGMEASGTGNMKLAINGALTIGTEDGANVEMRQAVTDAWWPFRFGATSEENHALEKQGGYDVQGLLAQQPMLAKAMQALTDGSLVENEVEAEALKSIANTLLHGNGSFADRYFVLKDLPSYYDVQKKVEALYAQQDKWLETVVHNIAAMGTFSSDESIKNYANKIWSVNPCPPDEEEIKKVREEFSEQNICKIYQAPTHQQP